MTYNETLAIVYRIVSAYPSQARHLTNSAIEGMAREWQIGLANLPADGVMEAVSELVAEQKWMPSLSEVISKILDIQYGTNESIIKSLNRKIQQSSACIIFGQVTQEQIDGYNNLTALERLIVRSPSELNMWLGKDYAWKEERVKRVKREIQHCGNNPRLGGSQDKIGNFDVFKALEERKNGNQ